MENDRGTTLKQETEAPPMWGLDIDNISEAPTEIFDDFDLGALDNSSFSGAAETSTSRWSFSRRSNPSLDNNPRSLPIGRGYRSARFDRIKGMLIGVAVGEALGLLAAGEDGEERLTGRLDRSAKRSEGWGPARDLAVGQCGEAGELTFLLASLLETERPHYRESTALEAYLRWANNQDLEGRTWREGVVGCNHHVTGINARALWRGVGNPGLFRNRMERRFVALHGGVRRNGVVNWRQLLMKTSLITAPTPQVEEIAQLVDVSVEDLMDLYRMSCQHRSGGESGGGGETRVVSNEDILEDKFIDNLRTLAKERRRDALQRQQRKTAFRWSKSAEGLARCTPLAVVDPCWVEVDTRLTNPHALAMGTSQRYVAALGNLLEDCPPSLVVDHCCRVQLLTGQQWQEEYYGSCNVGNSFWSYKRSSDNSWWEGGSTWRNWSDTPKMGFPGEATTHDPRTPWGRIGTAIKTGSWHPAGKLPFSSLVEQSFGMACWAITYHDSFETAMAELLQVESSQRWALPWWCAVSGGLLGARLGFRALCAEPKTAFNIERVLECHTNNGEMPRPSWIELRHYDLDGLVAKMNGLAMLKNDPYLLPVKEEF